MSSSNSHSKSTFQSFSTSFSSSSTNGQTTSRSETTYSDPSGTRVHRTSQDPGQEPREERFETDHMGRRVEGGAQASGQARIEDVTDKEGDDGGQDQRDREYEERIEGEYAKREGGA
ncbi:Nn.00g062150.m01.CDS01 [Neocucurbitaria sp. VM-36]